MSEARQQRFYSYNAVTNEQQDRLRMIRIPVQSFFNDNSQVLLETFSINTQVNQRSRFPPVDTSRGRYAKDDDTIIVNTTRGFPQRDLDGAGRARYSQNLKCDFKE
ncbi:hypothetical protein E5D57_008240 [Metarhizium anisopliae]|nr:hypothetical protein E5D57_008240 [Metarhizium anisopliae]